MYYSKLFIPTSKETPKEAVIHSHVLMIRAGMVKKVSSGIYSLLPLGCRVIKKIENIVREEMDRIGSNEFFLPVLIPGELWKESGRWLSMGPELFRLKDRNAQDFLLAPTHEEVFTFILKDHIKSYRDLPVSVYQIGLKFRDEIRPRYGVMRVKSFIMKDAYSFHREDDLESLDRTYRDMARAYRNIFQRCGLMTIPVAADPGAMGGSQSEEFMVPSQVGEEEIIQCSKCGYAANREKAVSVTTRGESFSDSGKLEPVETPGVKTIEDLVRFLEIPAWKLIKTMVYKIPGGGGQGGRFILALIRGDLEVNEAKLKNYLGAAELELATAEETQKNLGIPLGFAGPVGVDGITIVADESVREIKGGVTGANRENYHYKNVNPGRDFKVTRFIDIKLVNEGDECIHCGEKLKMFKGIELGHIFKLGDKYTKAFSVTYLDEDGKPRTPLMGCYGIGIERTAAAVIEQHHDENGIIWPITVSPFQVHIIPVTYEGEVKEIADSIYQELIREKIEVLLDDRIVRAGVKFNDADLIGIPFRITVGSRGVEKGTVELKYRADGKRETLNIAEVARILCEKVNQEKKKYLPIE